MAPGERAEITCLLGQASSLGEVHDLVRTYRDDKEVEATLRRTQTWWDDRLGAVRVHTPELAADIMINHWLPYQNLACRVWGRSAFYQSGGAFGFRDQLQDVMALLYTDPAIAREHILLAAGRQFPEGDGMVNLIEYLREADPNSADIDLVGSPGLLIPRSRTG